MKKIILLVMAVIVLQTTHAFAQQKSTNTASYTNSQQATPTICQPGQTIAFNGTNFYCVPNFPATTCPANSALAATNAFGQAVNYIGALGCVTAGLQTGCTPTAQLNISMTGTGSDGTATCRTPLREVKNLACPAGYSINRIDGLGNVTACTQDLDGFITAHGDCNQALGTQTYTTQQAQLVDPTGAVLPGPANVDYNYACVAPMTVVNVTNNVASLKTFLSASCGQEQYICPQISPTYADGNAWSAAQLLPKGYNKVVCGGDLNTQTFNGEIFLTCGANCRMPTAADPKLWVDYHSVALGGNGGIGIHDINYGKATGLGVSPKPTSISPQAFSSSCQQGCNVTCQGKSNGGPAINGVQQNFSGGVLVQHTVAGPALANPKWWDVYVNTNGNYVCECYY